MSDTDLDLATFRSVVGSMPYEQRNAILCAVYDAAFALAIGLIPFSLGAAGDLALKLTDLMAEHFDEVLTNA